MLTDAHIDNMPAGPEMDALVAERVMGAGKECRDCDGSKCSYWGLCWQCQEQRRDENYGWTPHKLVPFPYSTDISAAWEVAMKVGIRWVIDMVPNMEAYSARCEIENGDDCQRYVSIAPTAPLAICRAALKAVNKCSS